MPRARWLAKNRWPALEALWQRQPPPDEEARLRDISHQPRAVALRQLSEHVKVNYKPQLPLQTLEEVFARGDDRFWRDLEDQSADPEFLMGWALDSLLVWETGTFPVPSNLAQARAITSDAEIDATLSWIVAMKRLAASRGVGIKTFIVPVASVDPEYSEFWQPWPAAMPGTSSATTARRDSSRRRHKSGCSSSGCGRICSANGEPTASATGIGPPRDRPSLPGASPGNSGAWGSDG